MKNQNDLIFSIVFGVLGLIAFGIAIATKPEPPSITTPTPIVTTDAPLPGTNVVYGTSLPAGSNAAGGAGGGRGGPSSFGRGPGGPGGPGGFRPSGPSGAGGGGPIMGSAAGAGR